MDGDVSGVRIQPHVVEFKDTEVNTIYKINITVKNISKSSKEIRYYPPQNKHFKLKAKNPEKPIAPGLEVPAVIEYVTQDAVEHSDRVVVTVDGTVIEVPLRGFPSQSQLLLDGPVDFGNVVANSKVIAREVSIYNHGSKEGEFKIKYSGEKPIAIIPSSGKIPANSAQVIKIEYVTKTPGPFNEHAKVKFEGEETQSLQIMGNIVEGSLELLSYTNEERMDCIKFDATYYGTDKTQSALLYNNGPEPVCFVAILNEDAAGQELGVDLTQNTSALLANKSKPCPVEDGQMNDLTSLVTAIPNQGMLGPYERVPIFFRFSPRWHGARLGFAQEDNSAPRQDFALFMQLKVVGASQGFAPDNDQDAEDAHTKSNVEGSCLEIALTGTALPVLVSLSPQSRYDFSQCPVGEHVDSLCTLSNSSPLLPVMFRFRRIAHFLTNPAKGKVKPQQSQEVVFSFAPNQVGTFKPTQYVDIIGEVADNNNPFLLHLQVIHSIPIQFLGKSDPIKITKQPVFNPGITPKISNEVGLYVDTALIESDKRPRAAIHQATSGKAYRQQRNKELSASSGGKDKGALVAFPNDRATSIRPSDRNKSFKTIFTHAERHTYVDPDYAFTDEEADALARHKQFYVDYIAYLRECRTREKDMKEFSQYNNDVDIAIKPAAGIQPKKLMLDEIKPDLRPPTPPNQLFRLLSTRQLAQAETVSAQKVKDGLNAVPTTSKEKAECSRILSPQELHQVIIGPPTIDFGEVCLKSVSQKDLNIVNNLNQYIHVNVHVDCRELRQTSPLSQVVPPKSKATLPLIFESNTKGRFQRSLDYTINNFYKSHVTVFSEVVPVALDLSTDNLELDPQVGNPADAGIRGVITLRNPLNYPAEFTWSPILGDRGTAFSIRPAAGTVDVLKELDCEVVFHPSFLAPEEGFFALQVHGGNTLKLRCTAKLGTTSVQFIDRRIMFGQVPLHLTTTRTAMLKNTSLNHAYFQVLDPNPFPGLSVSPIHGVVPVGGNAELKVHLTPNAVIKFDTRVQVAIRGWKNLELRMGGTVEPPCVEIDIPDFGLGGVYCGSSCTTPFRLINRAITKSKVEFDLSRYADFTLDFPGIQTPEDLTFQLMNPGLYTVTLQPEQIVACRLLFKPTEVASYDFIMPVTINQTGAPTPAGTPFPPTPAPSQKNSIQNHIIQPRPVHVTVATPRRKVTATALRQPLQISHHALEFVVSPATHEMASVSGIGTSKGTLLVNNSDKPLQWAVDMSQGNQVLDDGVFKFLHPGGMPYLTQEDGRGVEGELEPGQTHNLGVVFCPTKPGHYEVSLPIMLYDDFSTPYQYLNLRGELKAPKLWFDPLAIVLTPVPLMTEIGADFQVLAANYTKESRVSVEVPQVECDDGSLISPITVSFTDTQTIKPCCGDEGQAEPFILSCHVRFKSDRPCSFSLYVKFNDDLGNSFHLPVTATADNCLMTCYPFLAQHRTDHQIVCEQGLSLKGRKTASCESVNAGEAVLVPCDDPARPGSRPSTTATSSNFEISTSSYEDSSSQSVSGYSCLCGAFGIPFFFLVHVPTPCSSTSTLTCHCSVKAHMASSVGANSHLFGLSAATTWNTRTYTRDSTYPSTPRDGAANKLATDSAGGNGRGGGGADGSRSRADLASRSLGSALFPEEDSEEGIFHTEVLLAVQRWFSSQGWPGGPNPITLPESLRSGITKKPSEEKAKTSKGAAVESSNLKKEFKTVYDMVAHLSGKHIPGIPINNPLPSDPEERAKQVYWQHSTLLTFMRTQGAAIASIKPEYLMMPGDYKRWVQLQKDVEARKNKSGHRDGKMKTEEEEAIEDQLFDAVSKRAWTDVCLQVLKTLVLSKITPRQFKNLPSPYKHSASIPNVDPDPLCSNVYSLGERIVLLWLNHNYEQQRQPVWQDCSKGGVPPSRWVVNFDFDLLDGLVLAAVLGAHVPFLIKTHLEDMYTRPATAEQCLHNALKVVNAMRAIGIDYDIQAIDITDPNPISLLLLCVHLYNHLPHYLPKTTVHFEGGLHASVQRQIRLSNPSPKPLTYTALLAGHDADDFSLAGRAAGECVVVVPPRGSLSVAVEFTSRFLRPAQAVLVLTGRRQGANVGSTLVFTLATHIDNITPKATVKCSSPCYQLAKVAVELVNPFPRGGQFRVVLVEAQNDLPGASNGANTIMGAKKRKKSKKIRSRTDHGQQKKRDSQAALEEEDDDNSTLSNTDNTKQEPGTDTGLLSAFTCPVSTIEIPANGTATLYVHFLPFHTGRRQCSIIVVNENIGEFLYSVEATATPPLPTQLPFLPSPHSVRISSAAAAGGGRGTYGGDESIVYWKCEVGRDLNEGLPVMPSNSTREEALVTAAQQHMSPTELQRRQATGTLTSASLMANAIQMLAATPEAVARYTQKGNTVFTVTTDSKYYKVPDVFTVQDPGSRASSSTSNAQSLLSLPMLPVSFRASEAGHYPCTVTLSSPDDVRVYHIECTVTPEGSEASIEFTSPVHQPITQDIPIVNQTNHDWPLQAEIDGVGFVGPSSILAKAFQTTMYPLLYRPHHEGQVTGKLLLKNTADNVDHVFHLTGRGERPLPLDKLILTSTVRAKVEQVLSVPNLTKKKLYYRVESDMAEGLVSGPACLTVLPGQTATYPLTVTPMKRGHYKGVLAFVAGANPVKEVDSDGEEVGDGHDEGEDLTGYRVWYAMDITVNPAPPETTLDISCACQKKVALEVGVTNPTDRAITMEVSVSGEGVSGASEITLPAGERGVYQLIYFPAIVGNYEGKLIFYHEAVGEFWYGLTLAATTPSATTLPPLECELGRWVRHTLTLSNPTQETLQLIPVISNTNNFSLSLEERDDGRPIELRPNATLRVPLTFMPSTLGSGDHTAKIAFMCEQLGEWAYLASGVGLLPQPQDPVSITAAAGSNSTLIIPFRNPLDIPVMVDVLLTDKDNLRKRLHGDDPESAFCLLLRHCDGMRLGPKSTLDIPISFAPEDMKMFQALCTVIVRREDGGSWKYTPVDDRGIPLSRSNSGGVREIRWYYPVCGYPELMADTDPATSPPAIVECRARERVEERLEVTLSGVAPAAGGPQRRAIKTRAVTPAGKGKPGTPPEKGVVVGETLAIAEEFSHEFIFPNDDARKELEPAIALSMVRQQRDKDTGLVIVVFNIIYSPYKTMKHDIELLVKGAMGGLWRFPLRFVAAEPEPDDTIVIQAVGLQKHSSVGFKLSSQTSHPVPYSAFFVAGSDAELWVTPQSGELLPSGSLLQVHFKPNKYGKIYHGKLVVQSPDMQWTYSIRGMLPDYEPPRGTSSRPMAGPHPDPRRRADARPNFIKDNLRLATTAVSSPIKGAPVIPKQRGITAGQYTRGSGGGIQY